MNNLSVIYRTTTFLLLAFWSLAAFAINPADLARLGSMASGMDLQQLMDSAQKSGFSVPARNAKAATDVKNTDAKKAVDQVLPASELPPVDEIPRIKGNDHIIVYFLAPELLSDTKTVVDEDTGKEIFYVPQSNQQLFALDKYGVLDLSGIGRIALAGLTEEEASARVNLEPLLQKFAIKVKILPVEKQGLTALEPFGYDLFNKEKSDMQPETDIPVPSDYVVGPGDVIYIQLYGKENQELMLEVSREGTLSFPGIGAVPVAGMEFKQLKTDLGKRIKKQIIGVDSYITLGELRSIRVFVLGEVEKPGSYLVSGLSTMTHALIQGSGVKPIGSLRNVQLMRNGKAVRTLDIYDLLLRGDSRDDLRLQAGDVVHVPPVKSRVGIDGEVLRPGLYELKDEQTIDELIKLAGGVLPDASLANVKIERASRGESRQLIDVDLTSASAGKTKISAGDYIKVQSILDIRENGIALEGQVHQPGWFQWKKGLRIVDVIPSIDTAKENADLEYILIKRYLAPDYKLQVLSSNVRDAIADPQGKDNIELMPRDEILVLDFSQNRALQVQPLIDQLKLQSVSGGPSQVVRILGHVHGPGSYPLQEGMKVSDLIRAGGKLTEAAYTVEAELTRYISEKGKARTVQHLVVRLDEILSGNNAADVELQAFDLLNIKEIPQWEEQDTVEIVGEARFPGKYAIQRGETLSELLKRAGGLTAFAYPQGAVFMREDLRKREQERIDEMARNLEAELATLSLERADDPSRIQAAGSATPLLDKLKTAKAAGRLVIDLSEIVKLSQGEGESSFDVILRGGDKLVVPAQMQEVSVIGQVFHPTSHLFQKGLDVDEYVGLSGGVTNKADAKNVYVIRANGAVQLANKFWFSQSADIRPGDTIVVPFDADRMSALRLWTSLSQIVYQLGLSAAAWHTVGLL